MNYDRRRVDVVVVVTWTLIGVALCGLGLLVGFVAQRLYAAHWPWISAHADAIVTVLLAGVVVVLTVLVVAEKAKKDNPSW